MPGRRRLALQRALERGRRHLAHEHLDALERALAGADPRIRGVESAGYGDGWAETVHQGALGTLKKIGQGSNPECLPCHTVGYGLPSGFVSEARS